MTLPSPGTQSQNKTAQKGNGVLDVLTPLLDYEMLTMDSTVIADLVIGALVIKPPEVVRIN